ncbi:MAG: hypothetical protein H6621_05310 [Halobacteriovoraceae bacterium]|nr:hypothetical protein [Halobacteriovoraceae bacterium]
MLSKGFAFLGTLFFIISAQASDYHIQGLSFSYSRNGNSGQGSADIFFVNGTDYLGVGASYDLYFDQNDLNIEFESGTTYLAEDLPLFISEAQKVETVNYGAKAVSGGDLKVGLSKLASQFFTGTFTAENLSGNCRDYQSTLNDPVASFLETCLGSGKINLTDLIAVNGKERFHFENLVLDSYKNKIEFKAKFKAFISGNLTGEGKTFWDPVQRILKIEVIRLKLGIIDIYKMFFKNLSSVKSKYIKVSEPYIDIYL